MQVANVAVSLCGLGYHHLRSTAMKILLSYVQYVSLARRLDIRWPAAVSTLFSVQEATGNAGTQLVSVACLFDELGKSSAVQPFYVRSLVFVSLPVIGLAMVVAFWMCDYWYQLHHK